MRQSILSKPAMFLPFALGALLWATTVQAQSLGEGAAAMVESVENAPKAGVEFLDYVFPGQVIDLGRKGVVVLSYFDTCLVETARGGRLTVERGASKISGGRVSAKKVPCQGSQMIVTASTSEAGAAVNRVRTGDDGDWSEWTVKSDRPIFKWPVSKRAGEAVISVHDMDEEPPALVWEAQATGSHLAYPQGAPELEIGLPYRVSVVLADRSRVETLFSIDPDMDAPDTAMSRVVPVGR